MKIIGALVAAYEARRLAVSAIVAPRFSADERTVDAAALPYELAWEALSKLAPVWHWRRISRTGDNLHVTLMPMAPVQQIARA